jgi:hypothetical protein
MGSHGELLQLDGVYAQLWNKQVSNFAEDLKCWVPR